MTQPTYEKHTTSTDALDTLGSIIGPGERRDAIHLAVEPAIAGEELHAGNHVTIDPSTNIAVRNPGGDCVGIVDPFLTVSVPEGDRFWLVVYPRQINSLRHVWEHSAFRPSGETDATNKGPSNRDIAEKWLRDYANREFDIREAVNNDGYLTIYGSDASGDIPEVFWDHLELYVGNPVKNKAAHFSCSC